MRLSCASGCLCFLQIPLNSISKAEFQLTEMSDRLPPLSIFTRSFKLDEWQKNVLRLIDENRSAVGFTPSSTR